MSDPCSSITDKLCETQPRLPNLGSTLISDANDVSNLANLDSIKITNSNSTYWAAIGEILGNKIIPIGHPTPEGYSFDTRIRPTQYQEMVASDIKKKENSFYRITSIITNKAKQITQLNNEKRLLPVESQTVDEFGVPTGGITIRYLELNEPLDSAAFMALPPSEQVIQLGNIAKNAKPILGALEDVDALDEYGISEEDIKDYLEIMKRANQLNEPALVASFYLKEEQLTRIGLSPSDIETIKRLDRLRKGSATNEDLNVILSGGYSHTFENIIEKVNETIEKSTDIKDYLKEAAAHFVSSPTAIGYGVELSFVALAKAIDSALLNQVITAQTAADILASPLVRRGIIQLPNNATTVRGLRDVLNVRSRGQVPRAFISRYGERITDAIDHHGLEHRTHHVLGKVVPAVVGIIYGCESVYYGYNAVSYAGTPTGDKYSRKSLKYGALAGIEALTLAGAISGGAGALIAGAIYFGNELFIEPFAKKVSNADFAAKRRSAASKYRLVPHAFEKGIVISEQEVWSAISTTDDDPENDLIIHRYGVTKPTEKTITYIPPYATPIPKFKDGTPEWVIEQSAKVSVPIVPINLINISGSRLVSPKFNSNANALRQAYKCKCCYGGCNGDSSVTEVLPIGNITTSPECANILANIAYQKYYDSPDSLDLSSLGNLWNIGYEELCGKGCFTENTKVLTPNGEIEIHKLSVGDAVISFNSDGELMEDMITHTFVHKNKTVYKYIFDNDYYIESTENHPVYTPNGFKEIGELNLGDNVMTNDGISISLVNVECLGQFDVYNIEVSKNHTYIANRIRVHNKFNPANRMLEAILKVTTFPPAMNPLHNVELNWPEPVNPEKFSGNPLRWNLQQICELKEEYGPQTPSSISGPLSTPLLPGTRLPPTKQWVCKYIASKTSIPNFGDSPFGETSDLYGYAFPNDVFNEAAIPVPPIQESTLLDAPPYISIAEPSNPYFPWEESNIDQYLKSYPFYLNQTEIDLVKNGGPTEIKNLFDGKDKNDINNLKSYHLILINQRYSESKKRDIRSRQHKEEYFNCITPKILG